MAYNFLVSFLLSFLAPAQTLTPNPTEVTKVNFTLLWMIDPWKYIPIHFYIMGGGAILIVVIGGPSAMLYWYCCRGKENAAAERARRNTNRETVCGQGTTLSTSTPPGGLQLAPPAYNEIVDSSPPAYAAASEAPTQTIFTIQTENESQNMPDLPPAYRSPTPTSTQSTSLQESHSVMNEDPPAYSPTQSRLPPVV